LKSNNANGILDVDALGRYKNIAACEIFQNRLGHETAPEPSAERVDPTKNPCRANTMLLEGFSGTSAGPKNHIFRPKPRVSFVIDVSPMDGGVNLYGLVTPRPWNPLFPPDSANDRGFSIMLLLYTGVHAAGHVSTLVPPSWCPRPALPQPPRHEFQTAPE
jgi:hypothetical protein